jgi:heme o synthase
VDAKQAPHLAMSSRPPLEMSSTRVMPVLRTTRLARQLGAYYALTKPRVVALIVFTAVVGMLLGTPVPLNAAVFLLATLGIALAAGSAAAFNHVLDRRADAVMARTRARPLPTQQLSARQAVVFATTLAVVSAALLIVGVNALTAVLTLVALVGYSVIYTIFLKPRTPQNIVIGGAAGAAPPLLGWAAVTGSVTVDAVLLFLIIFTWTPPHFWSLALYREKEYAAAGVPMLPVTHGSEFTRKSILAYTLALAVVTTLPWVTGMSGPLYVVGAAALNLRFIAYAWQLHRRYSDALSRRMFRFSINYLAALFALLLMDRYGPTLGASAHALAANLLL